MKVLAIIGSPRLEGNTSYLVDQALAEIGARGIETEKLFLSQYRVSPCLGHDDCAQLPACRQPDDTGWILEKFTTADGVILASPVYYYNVSAQMKTFIDRNFFLYTHKKRINSRCAGIMAIGGGSGAEDAAGALSRFLKISSNIADDSVFTLTGYSRKAGNAKNKPALVEQARNLGRRMSETLAVVK